jgi:hypothetical protein
MRGDWYCDSCGILNFASRTECFKCNGSTKKQDWVCKCKELNFSFRMSCRSCGGKKSDVVKDDDWKCLGCNEINYSFRVKCRKCDLPYGKNVSTDTSTPKKCIICSDKARDTAIKVCGHFGYCAECAVAETSCSVCDKEYNPATDLITIYDV